MVNIYITVEGTHIILKILHTLQRTHFYHLHLQKLILHTVSSGSEKINISQYSIFELQ